MWICSTLGFFSIVKKGAGFHVRARDEADLMRLTAHAGIKEKIQLDVGTDYAARVVVRSLYDVERIMQTLAAHVDYPNFKEAIHSSQHQRAKLEAYSKLWWDLRAVATQMPTVTAKDLVTGKMCSVHHSLHCGCITRPEAYAKKSGKALEQAKNWLKRKGKA